MTVDPSTTPDSPKRNRRGRNIALVGAGLAAGVIGATAIGASAQSSSAPSARSTSSHPSSAPGGSATTPSGSARAHGPGGGHGGSAPVRGDEKSVSASVAASLKAAALKAVPGGTVYRVETDSGDGVYEAHMSKADGTLVTVKFDKALKLIKVEAGMGMGDPAPAGRPDSGH